MIPRHDPWSRLGQLQRELDRVFESTRGNLQSDEPSAEVTACDWIPAVDIKEEPERFVLLADIAGVNAKDIEISVERGVLTLKGERGSRSEIAEGYSRMERPRGSFYRRFNLPDTADAEKIIAASRNGVLEVVIPKHERIRSRKITVES